MTVGVALLLYVVACAGAFGPRVLRRTSWTDRAPLLGIVIYLAATAITSKPATASHNGNRPADRRRCSGRMTGPRRPRSSAALPPADAAAGE